MPGVVGWNYLPRRNSVATVVVFVPSSPQPAGQARQAAAAGRQCTVHSHAYGIRRTSIYSTHLSRDKFFAGSSTVDSTRVSCSRVNSQ
jgi:hypothetical protein